MVKIYEKYAASGFKVVIISKDNALTSSQVRPFFESRNYPFTVLLDPDQAVSDAYKVKATPSVFVVAPGNRLLWELHGFKRGYEVDIEAMIADYFNGQPLREPEPQGNPPVPAE